MTINGHFWIENEEGKVIHDPVFPVYKKICKVHKLDINKPRYRKASPETQRENIKEHILPYIAELLKVKKLLKLPNEEFYKYFEGEDGEPLEYRCGWNCVVYKLKGGEGKVIYGDMGWEKEDGSDIWYEFENDLTDFEYDCRSMFRGVDGIMEFINNAEELKKHWKKNKYYT
tara:strand:+ start:25 stop:540 length:516 start_codon:yes stop_codon:yes gene_type:complete